MFPDFVFYLLFLLVVSTIYYAAGRKFSNPVLFAGSLFFIAFISVKAAVYALAITTINYFLGILLEKIRKRESLKSYFFWIIVLLNIVFLSLFKYWNGLLEHLNEFLPVLSTNTKTPFSAIFIPLGISYYIFQVIGYIILVSRGTEKAERNYFKFANLLLFFPKFLSGPVERSNHFLPQLENSGKFDIKNILSGISLIIWGAFKKFVIANNLFFIVNQVYSDVYSFSGFEIMLVFLIQLIYIYYDFSGYTDIALGSAKILGINIIDNFKRPLLAKSVTDFWKRWHISLSSWCNDFIFIPFIVKFRKLGNSAAFIGTFVTFFIIGIWHGAKLTFIILGVLQGLALIYEFSTKRIRFKTASKLPVKLNNTLSRIFVYLFISFSIIFFYSNSVNDAGYFITNLFKGFGNFSESLNLTGNLPLFFVAIGSFIVHLIFELNIEKGNDLRSKFLKQPLLIRFAGFTVIVLLIIFLGNRDMNFYYARF
ncbi:MAG: MBOAT family protein [Prolixibacteraceae bacterium]|nr:MBOAT family protein [Prolixibacteraceae bacterium]